MVILSAQSTTARHIGVFEFDADYNTTKGSKVQLLPVIRSYVHKHI